MIGLAATAVHRNATRKDLPVGRSTYIVAAAGATMTEIVGCLAGATANLILGSTISASVWLFSLERLRRSWILS